jgi:transcriptional regulator with XRE-family HTH domain
MGRTRKTMVGSVIRGLRKQLGLSLRQLAAKAEVHPGYLTRVERGLAEPGVGVVARLASALGVTVDELLRLAEELEAGPREE